MSTTFPTSKQSIPNPTSTDLLENADNTLDHDYQHATVNDTIEALQDKVGVDGSAVTTSHDYKLSGVTGSDKAVSKTGTETLTNKTLTAPQINFGSDANGDMIIRNGSGVTARLPIGTTDQILAVQSGLPTWIANPSASPASTITAGVVELATTAETETGTDATRAVTPDGLHDMTTLAGAAWFLDEDNMASDSATKTASQQSIKAYVDGRGGKIDVAYANVTVSNTTTETTLYSGTVPANTLGTTGVVRLRMYLSLKKGSTSSSFSLRFKYGGTTLVTHQINDATTFSTAKQGWVEFVVVATGATNTQEGSAIFNLVDNNQPVTTAVVQYSMAAVGTSAVDSTANQTIAVTVQFGGTSASDEALMYHTILEKV